MTWLIGNGKIESFIVISVKNMAIKVVTVLEDGASQGFIMPMTVYEVETIYYYITLTFKFLKY